MNKSRSVQPRRRHKPAGDSDSSARIFSRDGRIDIVPQGRKLVARRGDLYHWFLSLHLWSLVGLCAAAYMLMNSFFAVLYLLDAEGIANARPGSFGDREQIDGAIGPDDFVGAVGKFDIPDRGFEQR